MPLTAQISITQLLDGRPVPKVIDFGIAKAVGSPLSDRTLQTQRCEFMGTPEYMCPEQAALGAGAVDTRADVYSLGVVLYELLAGVLPFEADLLRANGIDEARRILRDIEPPRPSTKLSSLGDAATDLALRRATHREALIRQLQRELEWIPLKAMRKDRTARYRTCQEMADDVRNYLAAKPLIAGPESMAYRMRKFVRRHRVGAGVTGAGVIVLLLAVVGTTLAMVRENRLRAATVRARDDLEVITTFQSEMLSDIDAEMMGATVRRSMHAAVEEGLRRSIADEGQIDAALVGFDDLMLASNTTNVAIQVMDAHILSRAGDTIDMEFAGRPTIDAALRQTLAEVYRGLGLHAKALEQQERALKIRRDELGDSDPDTLYSINGMGEQLQALGRYEEAEAYLLEAVALRRAVLGDNSEDTLTSIKNLAGLLLALGRTEDAEPLCHEALNGLRAALGDSAKETLDAMENMGFLYQRRGQFEVAEQYYREALKRREEVLGRDHHDTLLSLNNLGGLLLSTGHFLDAEPYCREALELKRERLGDDHPDTIVSMNNLTLLLMRTERSKEADALGAEAVARARRALVADRRLAIVLSTHADVLAQLRAFKEAQAEAFEAYETLSRAPGAMPEDRAYVGGQIARIYEAWDETDPGKGYDMQAAEWRARLQRGIFVAPLDE